MRETWQLLKLKLSTLFSKAMGILNLQMNTKLTLALTVFSEANWLSMAHFKFKNGEIEDQVTSLKCREYQNLNFVKFIRRIVYNC